MNLQEHIRRILREESISVNMKTVQSDLINMIGPSKIKIVNTIGSFNSSFKIIVDHLDQEILDKINNYMNENGWFPHSIGLSDMKERIYSQNVKNYIGEDDVQIGYESNTPEGINITQTKAFHVTPDIFLDKIMETGLNLKSEGKLSDHPSRIYLFLNGDKNTQKGMVWAIWNSLSKERQETIKNYYVLEIDLTQIPNHKFYRDPQAFITYNSVYVDQPIPKSAIKVIDKIDTSNIKTENGSDMTKEEEKIARDEKKRKEEERIEQQKKSDSEYDQFLKFKQSVDKLPDNLKNMNIDDLMNIQESIRRILREEMELNPTERVYDYDPGRDTVPERLPFDIDKLVDSKVVFVTPAIDGDPESETYKEWLKEYGTHLISLYNVENSSEDGWIRKAITKKASTKDFKGNFVDKLYDGKYNQILWSLEKLGINPMDMLIDVNLQENIRRILREEKLHATPQELIKNLPKELKELLFKQWGAKQNPEWHPEGNTLKHIIVVIKRAYHHYPDDPNMVMAALFHDLGKIDTYKINPKTNQPTAYGHEDKSTDYVEKFKDWIESFEGMDVEEIKYLVKNHMKVKPSTWDQMKDKKKEPIMSHPAFDKLMGFTDKLDGGGTDLKESIRRIIKEELRSNLIFLRRVPMDKLEKSFGYALKEAEKKYYKYLPVLKDDYKLHFFTREVIILLLDSISHLMYPTTTKPWYDETFADVKKYFKDRIKERWETL